MKESTRIVLGSVCLLYLFITIILLTIFDTKDKKDDSKNGEKESKEAHINQNLSSNLYINSEKYDKYENKNLNSRMEINIFPTNGTFGNLNLINADNRSNKKSFIENNLNFKPHPNSSGPSKDIKLRNLEIPLIKNFSNGDFFKENKNHAKIEENLIDIEGNKIYSHGKSRKNWEASANFKKKNSTNIRIKVFTSKWKLNVMVNDEVVYTASKNQTAHDIHMLDGGLYLVVLHQEHGSVMLTAKYRTFEVDADMELIAILKTLQKDRIVILAAMNEAFSALSKEAKMYLTQMGSRVAEELHFGARWAWVYSQGGPSWAEGFMFSLNNRQTHRVEMAGHMYLTANVPKIISPGCTSWSSSSAWTQRQKFCDMYEGYGDLCNCHNPLTISSPQISSTFANIKNVPTIIVASRRPLCLYRCLKQLMTTEGNNPRNTLVVADGPTQEVRSLVSLFKLKFSGHDSGGKNVTLRITRHYKFVFDSAFDFFPEADMAIILEEDLEVSPDFYRYFSQTAPLLRSDPTLYCVSAWNDYSQLHTASDTGRVLRIDTMAGLGWLLSKKIYDEVIPKWPKPDEFLDWDMWMRLNAQQQGRECLVPEVSRTFHFGTNGAHLTSYMQANYFADSAVNTDANANLTNIDRLGPDTYDTDLVDTIRSAHHLDGGTVNPCDANILPRNSNETHILWLKMNDIGDDYTWKGIMHCLSLWDLDIRCSHKLVWQIKLNGTPLLLIAWPSSPFAYLKPLDVNTIRRSSSSGENEPPVKILIGSPLDVK